MKTLADAIRSEFPSITIETFAYEFSQKPPNVTTPRENVIVKLAPINANVSPSVYEVCQSAMSVPAGTLSSLSTRLDTTHALLSSARHSSMNRTRLSSMIYSGGRGLPRSSRSGATRSTTEPLGSSNRGRAGGPQHRTFSSAQAKTSRGSSLRAPCRGTVLAV
jgi:hypothetical protein